MVMEIKIGDMVRLKKKHPCGSYEWRVTRVGADIGIACGRRTGILFRSGKVVRKVSEGRIVQSLISELKKSPKSKAG